MATPTVNVVRYSALFGGILYGFYHNRTLHKTHEQQKLDHAVHDRENLIKEAKEAYLKSKIVKKSDDLITDPENPKFDLEKVILSWEKGSP
ncbi:ATP synthase E chain-domain-containing protein [Flagelloscypha sp. PMI_526]|nr:ATP synthase E chain-domain-containing protein [Flagelloscypha sp. PMI_526]